MFATTIKSYKQAIKRLCDLSQPQPKIGPMYKSMTPKQKALIQYCIWRLYDQGVPGSQIVNHFKCSYNLYWIGVRWKEKQAAKRSQKIQNDLKLLRIEQAAELVQKNNEAEPSYSHVVGYRPQRYAYFTNCGHEFIEERKSKQWPIYDNYHGVDLDDFLIESTFHSQLRS